MEIQYHPGIGFNMKDAVLTWGMHRSQVREALVSAYKQDDIFDSAEADDDPLHDLPSAPGRDIYHDLINPGDLVFISYDAENVFSYLEYHDGISLSLVGYQLKSGQPVGQIADWFRSKGYQVKEKEPGKFNVPELKFVFASAGATGGVGTGLLIFMPRLMVANDRKLSLFLTLIVFLKNRNQAFLLFEVHFTAGDFFGKFGAIRKVFRQCRCQFFVAAAVEHLPFLL